MIRCLIHSLIVIGLTVTPAYAHKVIASVFPSGKSIEGEIGFSNGDMAANALVEVFDDVGNKIGETHTDADGLFTFTPTIDATHIFKSDLGAGHVANVRMEEPDVAKILGKEKSVAETKTQDVTPATDAEGVTNVVSGASLTPEELEAIATAVRDEMRPLRKEIDAYKEKNDMQSILGGIGYIAGLFGLGFYLAARRKLQS